MKSISIFILLMMTATTILAQKECKRIRVHAFVRNSVPGNIPRSDARENGSTVERPVRPVTSYQVYIENPSSTAKPVAIYIDGTGYKADWELVEQTPVIVAGGEVGKYQRNDTILPSTKGKVYKLRIGERLETVNSKLQELSKSNAAVIELFTGKRRYYSIAKEWKNLKPVVLQ